MTRAIKATVSFNVLIARVTIPDAVQMTIHAQKHSILQIAVYRQMVDLQRSGNADSSARLYPQPGSKLAASRIEIALAS